MKYGLSLAPMSLLVAWYVWHRIRELKRMVSEEKRLRLEERRGRTRAEVCLRNMRKEQGRQVEGGLVLRRIGVVRTPFVKRAGTPRQGQVCPSSRGRLILDRKSCRNVTAASLDGLDAYSHAWLLFEFHANTDDPGERVASKVCPPRGYGERVGWMATRSPHRANPIGLSLVKLESVDRTKLEISLSAIDLCDGTPVLDLKPYVPWDQPNSCVVPDWVAADDTLRSVTWRQRAVDDLCQHAALLLSDLYDISEIDVAKDAINQLLRHDPRNKRRRNARRTNIVDDDAYRICFADIEIEFKVDAAALEVHVLSVSPAPPDPDRLRVGVVDAVRRPAEAQEGRPLTAAHALMQLSQSSLSSTALSACM